MYLSYCYVSVHDRVYHSFPTRRSSDLVSTIATERDRSAQGSWTWTWTRTRTWTRTCTWTRDVHVHVLVHVLVLVHVQDRKSTRLNSSHANISYAVFCLKKKKEILHQQD